MGRKGDAPRHFVVPSHAGRVTKARFITFLTVGFVLGLGLGYVFMGTMHAFLEIGTKAHHGENPAGVSAADAAAAEAVARLADAEARAAAAEHQLRAAEAKVSVQQAMADKEQEKDGRRQAALESRQQAAAVIQQEEVNTDSSYKNEEIAEEGVGTESWPTTGDTVHIAYTSNGSPYTNYQNLVLYGTYLLAQKMPGGDKMVGFTRILHRQTDDALSQRVPTFRADPLHPECDGWCDYPVADRPNAVRQFLEAAKTDASLIQAPWLYMIETDFVFVRPIAAPLAESTALSIAFPYGYIQPEYPTIEGVMRQYYPAEKGPLSDIPPTGPSPALFRVAEWQKVTPLWESLTAQIEGDDKAKEALEWVREMYAFSIACALSNIKLDMQEPPESVTMIQPPADHSLGKAHLMHYTWGPVFKDANGTELWHFDKRDYTEAKHEQELPKLPLPPPFEKGWLLQDGLPVTKALYDTVRLMINTMNKGIDVVKAMERRR